MGLGVQTKVISFKKTSKWKWFLDTLHKSDQNIKSQVKRRLLFDILSLFIKNILRNPKWISKMISKIGLGVETKEISFNKTSKWKWFLDTLHKPDQNIQSQVKRRSIGMTFFQLNLTWNVGDKCGRRLGISASEWFLLCSWNSLEKAHLKQENIEL